MAINRVARSNHSVVDVSVPSAVTAPTFAFEGGLCVFYTRDAPAGAKASPNCFNTIVAITKATLTDTFDVGDSVYLSVANQNALTAGGDGKMGICAKASSATDPEVMVALNE